MISSGRHIWTCSESCLCLQEGWHSVITRTGLPFIPASFLFHACSVWIAFYCLLIPTGMWLWLWGGCSVCDLPAAQVQGGLGLSEMQAMPGLCGGEPLPEGKLFCHQWCCLRGLLARVGWMIFFPCNYSIVLKQAFFVSFSKCECTLILTWTHLLGVHEFVSQQ